MFVILIDNMIIIFSFHFYMRVLSQVVSYMFSTEGLGDGMVNERGSGVSDLE